MIYGLAVAALGGGLGATMFPVPKPAASAPAADHARLAAAYALPSAGDLVAAAPRAAVRDLECLTQAVYFEARGETAQGQAAVAQVVLNRVKVRGFPKTVCGVVYQGAASRSCQFSFACDGAAEVVRERGAWVRARRVAARALAGAVMPQVAGATHFHTTAVSPNWGAGLLRVSQVGLHVFYRPGKLVRPAAPAAPAPSADLEPVALEASTSPESTEPAAPAAEAQSADAAASAPEAG